MGKILHLEQGSDDWHVMRSGAIGSSDAGVIAGFEQWKSKEKLWLEKSGQIKTEFKTNPAMERGQALEPSVRAEYELKTDLEYPPAVFLHSDYDFLLASLDGWNSETNTAIEIKCPNKKAHACAASGQVPDYYYPQVQHILLCSGASKLIYISFNRTTVEVEVLPDLEYQKNLLEKEIAFWDCVKNKRCPE
jgi:putative phage-type endonuclease